MMLKTIAIFALTLTLTTAAITKQQKLIKMVAEADGEGCGCEGTYRVTIERDDGDDRRPPNNNVQPPMNHTNASNGTDGGHGGHGDDGEDEET